MNQIKELPTMSELIADDNYLCSMNFEDFGVALIMMYQGTDKVEYYLFEKQLIIFHGNDFMPSPMNNGIDTIQSCVDLLAFLTVQKNDVDSENFANYTPEQIVWSNSSACEQINTMICDFEGGESVYLQLAKDFFENAYTN